MKLRYFLILFLVINFSCKKGSTPYLKHKLPGKWLLVYMENEINTDNGSFITEKKEFFENGVLHSEGTSTSKMWGDVTSINERFNYYSTIYFSNDNSLNKEDRLDYNEQTIRTQTFPVNKASITNKISGSFIYGDFINNSHGSTDKLTITSVDKNTLKLIFENSYVNQTKDYSTSVRTYRKIQ